MTRFARPALAILAAAILAACQQQAEPAKTTTPPPAAQTAPAPTAPAATPAPAPAAPAATADSVGIPECDSYLTKYEACVSEKVPAEARAMMKQSMDGMRAQWRGLAADATTKAGLAQACTAAKEAAKASMSAYGCTDF
ncbi:hypothetical protein [Tahibacter amnicola]|uniref:Glutaconyl-CoA decarboxylase subunit gamma n=1 Tax=Tahibacter amnicola TaxID=2976241 RepID=A0ABY6BE46_9GAMM|nr:hypothetical protein [Tahibacter amnicola]UXI67861.1 hypothetical protein N4264_24540 [Tahibacter amnicola]